MTNMMSGKMEEPLMVERPKDTGDIASWEVEISDFVDLASYNWLDKSVPTILVPGAPPIWSPPRITPHLKADSGMHYIDQNSDRYPWSPLEPLIRATYEMHPDYDFGAVDTVTDRRPLRKLLGFVSHEDDEFQFGVEVIESTVLLVRMEKGTREEVSSEVWRGYRRAFEEAYTKLSKSAKGSTSHHRIVSYKFGGLKLIVRSAVDAYLKDLLTKPGSSPDTEKDQLHQDDLCEYMKATSLEQEGPSVVEEPKAPGLAVVRGGEHIPHTATSELQTHAHVKLAKKPWTIQQKIADLWLSQTPNLIIAAHEYAGTKWPRDRSGQASLAAFVDIVTKDVHQDLADWETVNSRTLCRYLKVLKEVVAVARTSRGPLVVQHARQAKHLVVTKADSGGLRVVSDELRRQWSINSDASSSRGNFQPN